MLPFYYNNNQRFLQKKLDPEIIKSTKIFEKAEIRWICVDDIIKIRSQFRSYFQNIVDMIYQQKDDIQYFIVKGLKRNKTSLHIRKHKIKYNKTKKLKTTH